MTFDEALRAADMVALDIETTGLNPRHDQISVVALAVPGHDPVLFDILAEPIEQVFPLLEGKTLLVHNALFDLSFLMAKGFTPHRVMDTMLLDQILLAGIRDAGHGLKDVAKRTLGVDLSKEEQRSDWGQRPLTEEQIAYALEDARVLLYIYPVLRDEIEQAGLTEVADIEMRFLPALVEMTLNGMPFDYEAWCRLAKQQEAEAARLWEEVKKMLPPRPAKVTRLKTKTKVEPQTWNLNSPKQVLELFDLLGIERPVMPDGKVSTNDSALALIDHPFVTLLRQYRKAAKRASAFGPTWHQGMADERDWAQATLPGGRIWPKWWQIGGRMEGGDVLGGVATGRMSSSHPNMQQVPHDKSYRLCFAAPKGRKIIKCDLSQIELRIAARLSGEQNMLRAYLTGEDLHKKTAAAVTGKKLAEVTKADRQLAKAVNFGFLYGMGASKFRYYAAKSYGVLLTEEEAADARETFFNLYPGLRFWHSDIGDARRSDEEAGQTSQTRTLWRRRRIGIEKFTEMTNTPVQGTGADGLKLAAAMMWERRGEWPSLRLLGVVHDEVIAEADEADAEGVAAWMQNIMCEAFAPKLAPVPVEAEATIGQTWGGDPEE